MIASLIKKEVFAEDACSQSVIIAGETDISGKDWRGGEDLHLEYSYISSPFGIALLLRSPVGICGLGFCAQFGKERLLADYKSRWPKASYRENPDGMRSLLDGAFVSSRSKPIAVHFLGSAFQIKVWRALLSLSEDEFVCYSDIAQMVGKPSSVRAVANAIGRNPIAWLIPCHLILRKNGGLGGYHFGLPIKRQMIEFVNRQNT